MAGHLSNPLPSWQTLLGYTVLILVGHDIIDCYRSLYNVRKTDLEVDLFSECREFVICPQNCPST